MQSKRIFIVNGHPAKTSLSWHFAQAYLSSAQTAGHDVRVLNIADIDFDMDFGFGGYKEHKPLEPCLVQFQQDLEWCEHVVLMTPMWWGGLPAKLKGLFDRTFLPGWAFDTRIRKFGMPMPMLSGKTARIFLTSDTPNFFFSLLYRKALLRQVKSQILGFVGIKPTKVTHFSPVGQEVSGKIDTWLDEIAALAAIGQ